MIVQEYKDVGGIKIFHADVDEKHSDYNAQGLDNLFAEEEKHFWFIARKEYILQNIQKYISSDKKIIEIGAGTGNVSRYLQENAYTNISVGEMHNNGLRYAKSYGIKECYQFDLLNSPFKNEFDTVCMFDVLEHIGDDDTALQNVYESLTESGNIVLTVPSHMWLWNRDDTIAGHKTRYTKRELIKKLETNGFEILKARYFFISIVPLLLLRTFLNRDNGNDVAEREYSKDISMNPLLNKILLMISRIENKLNNFFPNIFGGSLFVIARKI